jgi:hypothetical protein
MQACPDQTRGAAEKLLAWVGFMEFKRDWDMSAWGVGLLCGRDDHAADERWP